ncbi:MAG: wax ester/triacylglycerol synthase family O-acyltransferase [Pseudomonadota bacterium]
MLTQLSTQDASFAFMETKATPMHIGAVYLYKQPTAADGQPVAALAEADILKYFEERLHLWPFSRQRLIRVPFDLDYPYWIEDGEFDLEYHVRRIALPSPGDWSTLMEVSARIFSRPLDFSRPLWEFYLIEGVQIPGVVENGIAILSKTHHAAVDGASGMHLIAQLHELTPHGSNVPRPERSWRPDPVPSDVELMMRTGVRNTLQPFRFAQTLARTMSRVQLPSGGELMSSGTRPRQMARVVPKTRFNGRVTASRVAGGHEFELSRLKPMRAAVAGATVNDAVLAICGGGLRRYLHAKRELAGDSLVAMAPVNIRKEGDIGKGNQVSALFVPIGTEIADPIERLQSIQAATSVSKAVNNAVGARMLTDYQQFVPAVTMAQAGRLSTTMAQLPNPPFNVSITNVPGPQVPLYAVGAELVTSVGLGPITHGMGLIMPVTSYCGRIMLGFVSCRSMMPDPEFYVECLQESLEELEAAAVVAVKESAA